MAMEPSVNPVKELVSPACAGPDFSQLFLFDIAKLKQLSPCQG
jgi:hypothetical protein